MPICGIFTKTTTTQDVATAVFTANDDDGMGNALCSGYAIVLAKAGIGDEHYTNPRWFF